jgi:hypothetical protein
MELVNEETETAVDGTVLYCRQLQFASHLGRKSLLVQQSTHSDRLTKSRTAYQYYWAAAGSF